MRYVEAIEEGRTFDTHTTLFLAGGITGCPDWQQDIRCLLVPTDLTLLNPRRANFPINDPDAAQVQISWEHRMLRKADGIMFWFPKETICPIVLYELGAWSMTPKPIFIGVHPDYQRRQDVEIQTMLRRPTVEIVYSIDDLANQIIQSIESGELRVKESPINM